MYKKLFQKYSKDGATATNKPLSSSHANVWCDFSIFHSGWKISWTTKQLKSLLWQFFLFNFFNYFFMADIINCTVFELLLQYLL